MFRKVLRTLEAEVLKIFKKYSTSGRKFDVLTKKSVEL